MTDHRRLARAVSLAAMAATLGVFGIAAALWPMPAHAEVSVNGGQSFGPLRLEVISIVDDPDPFSGTMWTRYNADSASRSVLNDAGLANGDGQPSTLLTRAGTPLVAWARNSPQGYDVVLSRFEYGEWSEPEVLSGSSLDELDPHLFVNPVDDRVHLVYWVHDSTPRVMHMEAPADLSTWSTAVRVSPTGEPACVPHGVFHDGLMKVVYEVHDFGIGASPRQIVLATRDGQAFFSEMLSVTFHNEGNRPQAHSANGALWVDWIDSDGDMAWIRLFLGGWGAVQIEGFQDQEERDYHVRGKIESLALD
jgi:hypothetical protein